MIVRRPHASDGSDPERPIKVVGQGALPAAAAVLEGARRPAVLFVGAVATVVCEVTALVQSETSAIIARQEAWRTGAWNETPLNMSLLLSACGASSRRFYH